MNLAIEKAKKYGLGMVVARNSTHYGIAGYYTLMACRANMIGLTGTNARPSTAPTFGVENMLGTNPLVFGMPTREGKECPPELVIDRQGGTITDPQAILQALVKGDAALVPIGGIKEETGGHKGYGYATVVEILSAALQQGAFLKQLSGFDAEGNRTPYKLGHFFMAIDVEAFTEIESFKQITGDILRALRNSEKIPGAERIYTCGEKEHLAWLKRKDTGIPINEALQKDILTMRDELGLRQYQFEFESK